MPALTAVIPSSLDAALRDAAERRRTSVDSLVSTALAEFLDSHSHRMFQISTSTALVQGVYKGAVSSRALLEHGDFGLGTFENLDGEMVIVDGAIFQVRGDGSVTRRDDVFQVPFAVVAQFHEDVAFKTGSISSLKSLERTCDAYRESPNLFYALRVDGVFETMHTRAVGGVAPGMNLADAAKLQQEFHFEGVAGTLVCIWSPAYSSSFNIPGYHFHFISNARTRGGHVLDCSAKKLRVKLQMLSEYDVRLPEKGPFLETDLSRDPTAELAKTE
jgi:acetolactate decarboxylase